MTRQTRSRRILQAQRLGQYSGCCWQGLVKMHTFVNLCHKYTCGVIVPHLAEVLQPFASSCLPEVTGEFQCQSVAALQLMAEGYREGLQPSPETN